jgi:hypothetical protein
LAEGYIEVVTADSKTNFIDLKKLSVGPGSDGTVGIEIKTDVKTILIDIDVEQDEITLHKVSQNIESEQRYPVNEFDMGKVVQWLAS